MNGHSSFFPIYFNRTSRNVVAPVANRESLFLLTLLFWLERSSGVLYFQAGAVDCVGAAAIGLEKQNFNTEWIQYIDGKIEEEPGQCLC